MNDIIFSMLMVNIKLTIKASPMEKGLATLFNRKQDKTSKIDGLNYKEDWKMLFL